MKTFKQLQAEGVIQPNGTDKIKVESDLKDACWKGYEAIGTKKKNGKTVPNCVPVKEESIDEETGDYVVDIHHVHPDGKKEVFKYKVGAAKSARHAKHIAMQKHEKKNIPFKNFGASSSDVHPINESDAAYAAALEKQKENRLTKKDQGTMQKIRDLMAKEKKLKEETEEQKKAKDDLDRKLRKWKDQQRVDKALKDQQAKLTQEGAEADKHWAEAEKHLKAAKKHKEGSQEYHGHMSNHHDAKAEWHASQGRHNMADRESEKAEEHHKKFVATLHKEEVELDEGKMGQLHADIEDHMAKHIANYKEKGGADHLGNKSVEVAKKIAKMHNISHQAAQKHVNDYVEHNLKEETLDEISKDTLNSYVHKAFQHGNDLHYDLAHMRGNKATDAERKAVKDKISKRNSGVIKAAKKLREDSMLSLKEFTKEGYVSDAQRKAVWASKNEKNEEVNVDVVNKDEKLRKAGAKEPSIKDKLLSIPRGFKAMTKGKSEVDANLNKEELELDEAAWGKDKMANLRAAHDRHMEKALAANKAGDDEATKVHQRKMQMIQSKMNKLKQNEDVEIDEEIEILSEISKDTLKSYVKGASQDLPRLGNTLGRLQTHGKLPNVEKNISKTISNRYNGINKATDKLAKEEVEEIDELNKSTLASYAKKATDDAALRARFDNKDQPAVSKKTIQRLRGAKKAIDKLAKEETMVSYKDFMATLNEELKGKQHKLDKNKNGKLDADDFKKLRKEEQEIEEGKIDDLKDKIALKKATQSAYDKDYKPAAKSNVQKVKGHSYGAGEEEGEDDNDDGKKVIKKPASPEVKRGRGRPVGSKSGARN